MNGRPLASAVEIRLGRFGWAAEIPWLPDLLATSRTITGNVVGEAFGRQIAFLRALAAGAPPGAAVQLRYTAGGPADRVRCHLLAAASSEESADLLSRVIAAALPPELPLSPVPPTEVDEVLKAVDVDRLTSSAVAEIRRAVDQLDPTVDGTSALDHVVFPWSWSVPSLLTSLELLRQQDDVTTLVVHAEPASLEPEVALFLQDEMGRMFAELREGAEQPLTRTAILAYGRWLRLLPRAALHLRVLLAASGPLAPGLAACLSTELTAEGNAFTAADVISPATGAAIDSCALLLDELRSVPMHPPDHSEMATLLHLFDPVEAHAAFRFPVTPRGGLPGVGTQRPASVGIGIPIRTEDVVLPLGTTTLGSRFGLSRNDLNQHVVVAGLPGFGKSSTVRLLLQRAYEDLGLPFLVIDPAKSDYGELLHRISHESAQDCVIHRLTPAAVAFNPLAVPEGVAPSTHGGRIAAVFESVLDFGDWQFGRVLLRRTMARLYDEAAATGEHPTLAALYRRCGDMIARMHVRSEVHADLQAGLLGRIEMLGAGPAGRAFLGGAGAAVPWEEVMQRPTLIELRGFAGSTERSLLFGLLMAGLISWREAHPSNSLAHLTVLEEAHRVLRSTPSPDPGIDLFVDAIAELRGAGEGFIVVDQSPTSLHPSVMKLAGTKIVHRLVERDERNAMSNSMLLDSGGADDVARLGRKRAVIYAASADSAELIELDEWTAQGSTVTSSPATAVRDHLAAERVTTPLFCVDCPVICRGSDGLSRIPAARENIPRSVNDSELVDQVWYQALRVTPGTLPDRDAQAQAYCTAAGMLGEMSLTDLWRLPGRLETLRMRVEPVIA